MTGPLPPPPHGARQAGFTLIELLVAIAILSALALLSWRAIDGMGTTQRITQERTDAVRRLQSALGQWTADLDAVVDTRELAPVDFNGQVLRLTRRDAGETALESRGVRVVAWALRSSAQGTRWSRWQSAPLVRRDELARAWQRAGDWGRGALSGPSGSAAAGADSDIALVPATAWQLYYHRGETWTNPQSAVGAPARGDSDAVAPSVLPNGVRLLLTLPDGQPVRGTLVRDWVRPTLEAAP